MGNTTHYNKKLQPFAYDMRNTMTKAEAVLWKYVLKSKQMLGFQFRRQRPIENYIADFCCLELKLIIEVDGVTHDNEEQQLKDKIREDRLISLGYHIIRFQDKEILKNLESVIISIESYIKNMPATSALWAPPPAEDKENGI